MNASDIIELILAIVALIYIGYNVVVGIIPLLKDKQLLFLILDWIVEAEAQTDFTGEQKLEWVMVNVDDYCKLNGVTLNRKLIIHLINTIIAVTKRVNK